MAWTNPRTWVTGETVTAAHMNANVRDNLVATWPGDHASAMEAWTPTIDLGGSGDVGGASIIANYAQIGPLVYCYFHFDLAASTVMGTRFLVSMPVTAGLPANDYDKNVIGTGVAFDTGPNTSHLLVVRAQSTTNFRVSRVSGSLTEDPIVGGVPFTWSTDDRLGFTAWYPAAV